MHAPLLTCETAQVRARIDPTVKKEAEGILEELGLSPSAAISTFYSQIVLRRGLPFLVEVPNEVTIAAIEEARSGDDQVEAADLKEPLARLPSKRERTIDSVCRARHGADPPAVVDVHGNVMRLEHPADQPVERRVVAGELVG